MKQRRNKMITANTMVKVNGADAKDKPGIVEYVAADGYIGVRLVGEKRIDEWHPSQVQPISIKEAVTFSKAFIRV
jgi:hypothetical protein